MLLHGTLYSFIQLVFMSPFIEPLVHHLHLIGEEDNEEYTPDHPESLWARIGYHLDLLVLREPRADMLPDDGVSQVPDRYIS